MPLLMVLIAITVIGTVKRDPGAPLTTGDFSDPDINPRRWKHLKPS